MPMKPPSLFSRALRALNLPTLSLLALLQRTPVVQVAATAEEFVLSSPIGTVLKSFAAVAVSLGAMNSLAGATPLVVSSGSVSGISVSTGTAVSVFYGVNGTQTPPQSWKVSGTFAPGLKFSGLSAAGTVNVASLQLAGTPTAAGTYSVTITAYEFQNGTGIASPDYAYTITVTGSSSTAPSFATQPQSQSVNPGGSVTFTIAASGTPAPTLQWQKGGVALSGQTGTSLTLSNVTAGDAGSYTAVATNTAGTATSNIATLTVNVAPSFTTQPQSQTVGAGSNVTFTVAVSGTPTPTLQWQKGGTAIAGQTGTSLTLNGVTASDAANYTAVATNTAGTVTSATATLTVNTAPAFTTQPQSQTVNAGANVTFTVVASGTPTPTLQWQKAGVALSGQTGTSLTLNGVTAADAGSYTVVATNTGGSSTSNAATLTVNVAPAFTTQPQSQAVTTGGSVTFTVAVSGTPTPTLQWQKGGVSIAGQTGTSLALSNVQSAAAGTYTVVATNSVGAVTSNGATLTVNPTPPNTPASAGAFASGATEVTLTWQPPAGGSIVTGYKIDRATDSAFSAGLTAFTLATASTSYVDSTAAAGTSYFYRIAATNTGGASAPTATLTVATPASVGTATSSFVNISARAYCSTGNSVTIGGFVVSGSNPKKILVRAVGPSLTTQGLSSAEVLADPVVNLYSGSTVIASNDNWTADGANVAAVAAQVGAATLAQTDTTSAGLVVTLNPGVYSFIVSGKNNTSGIVLLEVYDADSPANGSLFVNISARASAGTGNNVTIGGFVVAGAKAKQVLVRAVGPTLTTQGIGQAEVLVDPVISLYSNGKVIATNDNWSDNANAAAIVSTAARIGATPLAQADATSSALLIDLLPGVYSFIASGKGNTSGIVLVEVYDAD